MDPRNKAFKIPGDQIKRLIRNMGGCFTSDRITVDGMKVGYMYREEPDKDIDSGWRFFSGDETQEYADNPDNFAIYEGNTICNYDPAIIPFLDAPYGSAFGRIPGSDEFKPENLGGVDEWEYQTGCSEPRDCVSVACWASLAPGSAGSSAATPRAWIRYS